MRNRLLIVVAGVLTLAGCDDRKPVPPEILNNTTTKTAPATTAPTSANPLEGPFKSLPMGFIPFVADAPESWIIKPDDLMGRIGLHGVLSSGEIDTLLSTRKVINADAYAALLAETKRATTESDSVTTKLLTRDKLTIIESVEVFGQASQSPAERPVGYSVKYFLQGESLDYEVYELKIADLSLEMFEKDGDLIRKVLLGLKYDPKAMEQTP